MNRFEYFLYRTKTAWSSFVALYKLPQEKVDAFVNAFDVFEHDWRDEEKLKQSFGDEYYLVAKKKLQDYYSVLNLILSMGSIEKMYVPPIMDTKRGLFQNQEIFEEQMMGDLQIQPMDRVLDIGCGRGRIAAHVVRKTKAHVTGINIDEEQLKTAKEFVNKTNLQEKTEFKLEDMNDLPLKFSDNSFHAVYQIQAFSYSKDLYKLIKEIHRVLKPGGRVSSCDWATLDEYNPSNPEHVQKVHCIKPLLGAVGTPTKEEFIDAFQKAGFKIIKAEVPSATKTDDINIDKASKEFGRIHSLIRVLVKIKILPKHFMTLLNQLCQHVDTFIEVDQRKLASSNFHIVAEKVE